MDIKGYFPSGMIMKATAKDVVPENYEVFGVSQEEVTVEFNQGVRGKGHKIQFIGNATHIANLLKLISDEITTALRLERESAINKLQSPYEQS